MRCKEIDFETMGELFLAEKQGNLMVEYLEDIQIRNILTKPELGLVGVFFLGDQIFQVLGKLSQEGRVRGVYFTHYYDPPRTEPHIKVGIRYDNLADLESGTAAKRDL